MLSKLSVKKPYTVVVSVVLIILLGVVSFTNMTVDLLPSMNLPYALVMTTYAGASPEEVEAAVTKPIEQTMATVSNIKNVSSSSRENASTVILEFDQTANMDSVTIEMRESLDQISGYWPEAVGNPIIMKLNPDMMPVMVAAVSTAEEDSAAASKTIEEGIVPELESIEGVASVSMMGTVEETVEITVNTDKIKALNGDVKAELDKKFAEASQALAVAKEQVESGKAALAAGKDEAAAQLGEAEAQISQKAAEITQAQLEIAEQLSQLNLAEVGSTQAKMALQLQKASIQAQQMALQALKDGEETVRASYDQLQQQIEDAGGEEAAPEELLLARDELARQIAQIEQYDETMAGLDTELAQVTDQMQQLETQLAQIPAAREALHGINDQLSAGALTIAEARGQMSAASVDAITQMSEGSAQLAVGEATIEQKEQELNSAKEEAYSNVNIEQMLNTDMIKTILAAQNFNMPAGYVEEAGIDYLIRVGERFKDLDSLKNLVIVEMEGIDPVKLSDVADVAYVDNSSEVYAKLNGESGVMLSIQKQTGYSTGDVSKRILNKFETLQNEQEGIHIITLMDQGVYIDLIVNSVLQNLVYGAILAIIILLVFLRSIRPTFVIACSIPISILAAIVMMYFSGVTLNVISLSGLALGVGMLVDNSIVVIENIYRMRNEEGASAKTAAIEGARQVSGAIAASTLTTICVFAPIVFTQGITRQLFVDMGLTIAYSLLASLAVALTLVPMMSAGLLKKTETKESRFFYRIQDGYEKLLRVALRFKPVVLILALALLGVSFLLAYSNGTAFMPDMESTQMSMTIETEEGTPLAETGEVADEVMARLLKIDDIESVGAMASSGDMMSNATVSNRIDVYAIIKEDKKLSNDALQRKIENDTKDLDCTIEISMSNMDMSALGSSGIVIQVKGKELDQLQATAKEISEIISGVKGTQNVSDGMEETTEELRIIVDKEKAVKHNLTVAQVYQSLAAKLSRSSSATTLHTDIQDYDIYVMDQKNESLTREDIKKLTVSATKQDGTTEEVPLSEIVTFTEATGLQAINRNAQTRYISVTSEIQDGDNIGLVSNRVKEALKDYQAPKGYEIVMSGEDETIKESMVELFKMLGLAVVFMYLIMVAQFQSLRSPFIIMFTVPLAFTGGLFGLFIADDPISVIAMVGFVMLSGIIVNNGIVFVDYTNQLISEGYTQKEALVTSGRTRLRPIIMTALTTILGLSTMAIGVGMGADMVQPMAIVTIGGLIYGTVLTLFVVPCIFDLFHKREKARLRQGMEEEIIKLDEKTD